MSFPEHVIHNGRRLVLAPQSAHDAHMARMEREAAKREAQWLREPQAKVIAPTEGPAAPSMAAAARSCPDTSARAGSPDGRIVRRAIK